MTIVEKWLFLKKTQSWDSLICSCSFINPWKVSWEAVSSIHLLMTCPCCITVTSISSLEGASAELDDDGGGALEDEEASGTGASGEVDEEATAISDSCFCS